jgi:diguanylate cyclase
MEAGVSSGIVSSRVDTSDATDSDESRIRFDNHDRSADHSIGSATASVERALSGGGRPAGLAWLGLVMAVMVAGAGALGIARLQEYAAQRHELRTMLAEIKASAWQQSALQGQAVAGRELTPAVARAHNESHRVAHALADQLAQRDPDSVEARAVRTAFASYYHDTLELEFGLLASGRVDDAERFDRERVEPSFERLITALTAADRAYAVRAAQASAQAGTGTILILVATAMITGGLVWLHRAGSRAYGRVAHRATHDPLTGLPNRRLLYERIAAAIHRADRSRSSAAILLIDLDRFKEVNDTLGHHHGDQLLIQVARRMQGALRHGDTVARLGGDEFAVLLAGAATTEDVAAATNTLRTALEAPYLLGDVSLIVGASVGAACYPQHARNADELLQHADSAMYAAKTGRSGHAVFDVNPEQRVPGDDGIS